MVVDMYEREVGAVKISFRIICYKGLHEETKAALAAFIAHFHGQILSMGDTAYWKDEAFRLLEVQAQLEYADLSLIKGAICRIFSIPPEDITEDRDRDSMELSRYSHIEERDKIFFTLYIISTEDNIYESSCH